MKSGKQIVAEAAKRAADSILDVKSPTACLVAPIEYEFGPVAELIEAARDQPEEARAWELLNAFASGDTQKQWSKVEPIAVLGEVYAMFAIARQRRQAALTEVEKMLALSKC